MLLHINFPKIDSAQIELRNRQSLRQDRLDSFNFSYLGNLLVEPQEGIARNTIFSITASGFYDDDVLTYQILYKNSEGDRQPLGM